MRLFVALLLTALAAPSVARVLPENNLNHNETSFKNQEYYSDHEPKATGYKPEDDHHAKMEIATSVLIRTSELRTNISALRKYFEKKEIGLQLAREMEEHSFELDEKYFYAIYEIVTRGMNLEKEKRSEAPNSEEENYDRVAESILNDLHKEAPSNNKLNSDSFNDDSKNDEDKSFNRGENASNNEQSYSDREPNGTRCKPESNARKTVRTNLHVSTYKLPIYIRVAPDENEEIDLKVTVEKQRSLLEEFALELDEDYYNGIYKIITLGNDLEKQKNSNHNETSSKNQESYNDYEPKATGYKPKLNRNKGRVRLNAHLRVVVPTVISVEADENGEVQMKITEEKPSWPEYFPKNDESYYKALHEIVRRGNDLHKESPSNDKQNSDSFNDDSKNEEDKKSNPNETTSKNQESHSDHDQKGTGCKAEDHTRRAVKTKQVHIRTNQLPLHVRVVRDENEDVDLKVTVVKRKSLAELLSDESWDRINQLYYKAICETFAQRFIKEDNEKVTVEKPWYFPEYSPKNDESYYKAIREIVRRGNELHKESPMNDNQNSDDFNDDSKNEEEKPKEDEFRSYDLHRVARLGKYNTHHQKKTSKHIYNF